MAGTAANARETSGTARNATRTGILATRATADARQTAGTARTAAGAAVLAAGTAVAVGVAAAATRVVLEDNVSGRRAGHCQAGRKTIRTGQRGGGDRRGNGSTDHQWFHEG